MGFLFLGAQGAGTYIVEAAAGGAYKLDKVELDTSTSGVTDDYKLTAATDDTITVEASSETALVTAIQTFLGGTPTSVGTLGAASSVGTYQTASHFQYSDNNGNYVINFNTDLIDGKYNIFAEDDAGNVADITNDQTFLIDRTLPILPKILLSDNTDTGEDQL